MFDDTLIDDMVTNYTRVQLSDNLSYKTRIRLENNLLILNVTYNLRNKKRSLSIITLDGEVLLPYTFLDFGRRCELNFNATQLDLDYYVTLSPKKNGYNYNANYDFKEWSKDFDLCFVGKAYSLQERLQTNIRIKLVGN